MRQRLQPDVDSYERGRTDPGHIRLLVLVLVLVLAFCMHVLTIYYVLTIYQCTYRVSIWSQVFRLHGRRLLRAKGLLFFRDTDAATALQCVGAPAGSYGPCAQLPADRDRQTGRQRNARPKPRTTIVVVCRACEHTRLNVGILPWRRAAMRTHTHVTWSRERACVCTVYGLRVHSMCIT